MFASLQRGDGQLVMAGGCGGDNHAVNAGIGQHGVPITFAAVKLGGKRSGVFICPVGNCCQHIELG